MATLTVLVVVTMVAMMAVPSEALGVGEWTLLLIGSKVVAGATGYATGALFEAWRRIDPLIGSLYTPDPEEGDEL